MYYIPKGHRAHPCVKSGKHKRNRKVPAPWQIPMQPDKQQEPEPSENKEA